MFPMTLTSLTDLIVMLVASFAGVFLGYFLAVETDRRRSRGQAIKRKADLLNLFQHDLNEIAEYLRDNANEVKYPVFNDAWDVAKSTGDLSLLTPEELDRLKEIYIDIRALNFTVEDFWRISWNASPEMGIDEITKGILRNKSELFTEILAAQKFFRWSITSEAPNA